VTSIHERDWLVADVGGSDSIMNNTLQVLPMPINGRINCRCKYRSNLVISQFKIFFLPLVIACIICSMTQNACAQVHERVTIEFDPGYVSPNYAEKTKITVNSDNYKFGDTNSTEIQKLFESIDQLSAKLRGSDLCGSIPVDSATVTIKVNIGKRAFAATCSSSTHGIDIPYQPSNEIRNNIAILNKIIDLVLQHLKMRFVSK
jgi:hypothetical protein